MSFKQRILRRFKTPQYTHRLRHNHTKIIECTPIKITIYPRIYPPPYIPPPYPPLYMEKIGGLNPVQCREKNFSRNFWVNGQKNFPEIFEKLGYLYDID